MTSTVYENVRPIALLMNNPREGSRVIVPGRRRFSREPLDTSEGCVLPHQPQVGMNQTKDVK